MNKAHISLSRHTYAPEEIKEEMQLDICISAIHRIIKGRLGFTYKKRQYMPEREGSTQHKGKAGRADTKPEQHSRRPVCIY